MTRFEPFTETTPETFSELEYTAHTIWAEAYGLRDLIRKSHPDEIAANRDELLQACDMIRAAVGVTQ